MKSWNVERPRTPGAPSGELRQKPAAHTKEAPASPTGTPGEAEATSLLEEVVHAMPGEATMPATVATAGCSPVQALPAEVPTDRLILSAGSVFFNAAGA